MKVLPSKVTLWHRDQRKDLKGWSRHNVKSFSTTLGSSNKKQTILQSINKGYQSKSKDVILPLHKRSDETTCRVPYSVLAALFFKQLL